MKSLTFVVLMLICLAIQSEEMGLLGNEFNNLDPSLLIEETRTNLEA